MSHENEDLRWQSNKDIFQDYLNQWDEALRKGTFDHPSCKPEKVKELSFFEGFKNNGKVEEMKEDEFKEWTKIYKMSMGEDKQIINEAKKESENKDSAANFKHVKESKKKDLKIEKKAKDLANNPNPVQHPTYGADGKDPETGRTRVTAGFGASSEELDKISELKKEIYKLEVKMSGKDGLNEKDVKNVQKKIQKLKDMIDEISNSFGGNFTNSQDHD